MRKKILEKLAIDLKINLDEIDFEILMSELSGVQDTKLLELYKDALTEQSRL